VPIREHSSGTGIVSLCARLVHSSRTKVMETRFPSAGHGTPEGPNTTISTHLECPSGPSVSLLIQVRCWRFEPHRTRPGTDLPVRPALLTHCEVGGGPFG
jgi:hypothetical protein